MTSFSDIFKSSFLENVTSVSVVDMVIALLLAFGVGMFIFFVYKKTYSGVMYSSSFGGTLVQDIPTTYHVSHRQEKDGAPFSHNVLITAGTMLHRIIGKTVLATNSYHHQCVKELAPGLIPNAYAAEGFIEGFEGAPDGPFLLAVQWHPEVTLDDDEDSIKPFAAFMDAVRAYMAVPCHG